MSTETITEKATEEVTRLADQNVDTTDTEMRYMAYFARIRTALRASTRYFAYVRRFVIFAYHILRPLDRRAM